MPPLKKKMNGKRYFNEIKKNAHINYFQSHIIIFLQNQFFNAILMKMITCSHRPSTSCFVTQICLPQFSIFEPPYPASYCTHIDILITINGLHSPVNFNWRNFSTVKNSITACCLNQRLKTLPFRCALGEKCKHLCVQGEV